MAGRLRIIAAAAGVVFASMVPALANNLNIGTAPIRPHVNFNSTLHIDVKPRTFNDIDLSDGCRIEDDRFKPSKRKRRCRQDR